MGLFIGFTYSGVLVFIPIELNSMGAGIWGSAFFFAIFALMIIISRPIVGKILLLDMVQKNYYLYRIRIIYTRLICIGISYNPISYSIHRSVVGVRLWCSTTCIPSAGYTISSY